MSKDKDHGGKSGRNGHDDHDSGHKDKGKLLTGTNGDDVLAGGSRNDLIIGRKGDDTLDGGAGNDWLFGGKGDDRLLGGAGNDVLVGDSGSGSRKWDWHQHAWWAPKGQGDDFLDGGAGNDRILAGGGDDFANYTLSENSRAHDVYDGGKGFDTLQLTLTWAELHLESVQADIAAFEAFLERRANPNSDNGKTFQFQSFDLDARNFEALEIMLLDAPPVARNDAYALDEDAVLLVPGPGIAGNDSDLEGSALSAVLVAGPAHGALALNADGSFSYTPEENFNGADSFTYKVNDGDLDSNVATVTLQVAPVNDAPVAADDSFATEEDTPATGNVLANDTDVDNATLAAVLVAGPAHGALVLSGNGSFSYTPEANFSGADSFTYKANDGDLDSNIAMVNLTVAAVNDAPVAADDAATTDEDTPVSGNVLANDADVDNATLAAALVQGPTHGALQLNGDGSYSYAPEANFYGTDSFTYLANDGSLDSGVATVSLTVAPVNDAPVASADTFATDEDTPVAGNVLANDADVDNATLAAVLVEGPAHGTLVLSGNGSFSYTPEANFSGADSFTYKVNDGDLDSNVATVALQVAPVNDAPAASADTFATDEDVPVSGNVLANDADVDNATLAALLVTGPAHGALALNADGSFNYTPDANFHGTDSFTYRANDGQLDSNIAAVTLEVASVNDAPVAADDVITGSGADGGPLRVAVIGAANGTYVAAAAQLEDSTAFEIDADAIAMNASLTEADWATILAAYDVVVLGGNGDGNDYGGTPLFPALREFVDAGGGAVTTGWFAQILPFLPTSVRADADYITPIAPVPYAYTLAGTTITILDPAHPIAGGIANYTVNALAHELAPAIDAGATPLATGTAAAGGTRSAIVYDEVGQGLTAYLGSLHMAQSAYNPEATRTGAVDQIFEQAVAWAAGEPDSGATTDEDTVLVIDDAVLLSNDTDVEGDALSILSVATTSFLGATLSLDTGGNVVYDPTSGLQYLDDGEVVTDTFTYTVSDGNGGTDTATVSLTVQGEDDAPRAEFDATSTDADSVIVGNVLANDFDPEGDPFTLLTTGLLTTEYGAHVTLAADGTFSYDPTGSAALQALPAGASVVDFFEYTISDGMGGTSIGTASFTVASSQDSGGGGVNDKILDSVPPGTELDYYIRFDDGTPEWLRLEGFDMALSNSGSVGSGGGASAGKATGLDINTLLGSSQTLVQLTEALATGKHLKGVEIEAYLPGGEKGGTLVDQYYFEDVLVTGLSTGASEFSTANNLSFDYAKFNHGHVDYKDSGTVDKITEAGWDFVTNKDAGGAGPSIAGDALNAKLDDALPLNAQLKYYVTYEGAGGWLELDSFSMGLSNGGSVGSGGGAGAGKLVADGASLGLGSSAQILALTEALASGKHFKDLEVEAYRSGGEKGDMLVDQYYFQDVLVTSLNTNNASSNQVGVDFGAFSHGHVDYKDDGTKGDVTEAGWSFIQNKDFSVPVDADFGGKDIPLDSVPPGTELDYYIRFDDGTPEWLRLEGFDMALSNSGSVGSGGGASAGKATGLDINTLLGSSQTLVQLTEALATGKHLKGVEIEAYLPGGEKGDTLVDQYYFEDVLVTGLSTGASEFSTANNLSFDYAKFNHGHVDYKDSGTVDKITEAGWDFVTNKDAGGAGPSIAGDALNAKLDDALPLNAQLKYYVTYEGAGGWLELDSFSMGLSNGGSVGSGGGAGAGKLVADGASLGLGSSAQILALTEALASGKHFKDLEVEAYRSGGEKGDMLVDQYYFQDVLVTSLNTNNASSNQVGVDFGAFSHGHVDYKDDGTKGDVTEAGWSFIQNKDFSVPVDADFGGKDIPLDSVPPGTELDYYIRFDDGTPEWLRLEGFDMALSNSGSVGSGGGASAGKATGLDINTLLGSSQTLVQLTEALATGKHLKGVEIEAYLPGGEKGGTLVDQYYFEDVLVTGLSTGASEFSTANNLSFDYAKFNHGHVDYKDSGTVDKITEAGWDFVTNKDAGGAGPSIAGDALNAKLDDALPLNAQLKYYVTYEGAGGWLELDSFSMGLSNGGSVGSGGGAGAGKLVADGASLGLGSSAQILALTEALASGKHFKDLEVEAYRSGGEKGDMLVDQYYFQDVLVTSLNTNNASSNQVGVDFGAFSHGHVDYKDDGTKGDVTEAGWSFIQNKDFSVPVDSDLF